MTETPVPRLLRHETGAVARLVLNRPAAGNSLSFELAADLRGALAELAGRRDIKVIVISGAGGRIFCAGHDLNEFTGDPDPAFLAQDFGGLGALMQAVINAPQIVIAEVFGVATAAGCELVAACDLALAASTARFATPGVNIGFWCHTPQIQLSRNVGRKAAMLMLATGELFPASHARDIGLINTVHDPDDLPAAVDALAARIASKSAATLARGKRSFNAQSAMSVPDAYRFAKAEAIANLAHADAKEGIAAFLEKRPPQWD
jgi:enoyl-CoA hydratase/carnithine racemase